jgi:hypothetical protein
MYLPQARNTDQFLTLVIRTQGDPSGLVAALGCHRCSVDSNRARDARRSDDRAPAGLAHDGRNNCEASSPVFLIVVILAA